MSRSFPDAVEPDIGSSQAVPEQVALNPVRVDIELIRPHPGPIGVEHNRDHIVAIVLITLTHGRSDRGRIILAVKSDEEMVVVIGDEDLGRYVGAGVVARVPFVEAVDMSGISPARIPQSAIDVNLSGGFGYLQCRLEHGSPIIGGFRCGRPQPRQRGNDHQPFRDSE